MSLSHREQLYQQVIVEHNRSPKNFGKLEPCTHHAEGFNPLCGDHYQLYMNISDDGTIEDLRFDGDGCAISKASSSMMTQYLKGKTKEQAEPLIDQFHQLITGKLDPQKDEHQLGKLGIFAGVAQYPARVKCASLSWHTLRGALNNEGTISTE